ncbi:DNA polymerase epsilon subunit 3 [Aphelenchoides besseyi]|nr:DNA polymerase epsilon subunit 3 [Aphelenchoides besseyi]KAI6210374.1 DNA polymerase epsilon subunit 3 [Aphelenchoides besseyi]
MDDEQPIDVEADAALEFEHEQRQYAELLRLPQASIDRIVREVLPNGFHAQKEVRVAFARAVAVFILSIGSAAFEAAQQSKRKGIVQRDVTQALAKMQLNLPELKQLAQQFKQQMAAQKADTSAATANESIAE